MDIPIQSLLEKEKGFWVGDESYYRENLAQDTIMIFPIGMLERDKIIETILQAPRWDDIQISKERKIEITQEEVLLMYEASAKRGTDQYSAFVCSMYKKHHDNWKMCFHQQTPKQHT